MSYFNDRFQGVGAIAAAAPAPRSAPAPSFGRELALLRRQDPELRLPLRTRYGRPREVAPGVYVQAASTKRPPVLLSGLMPGRPPLSGTPVQHQDGGGSGGHGRGGGRTAPTGLRSSAASRASSRLKANILSKPSASVPPTVMKSPTVRIGYGIGQRPGLVVQATPSLPPAPYGGATSNPVAPAGSAGAGYAVGPVLDEYDATDTEIQPVAVDATAAVTATTAAAPSSTKSLFLPIAIGAGLLYLLTRKRKRT